MHIKLFTYFGDRHRATEVHGPHLSLYFTPIVELSWRHADVSAKKTIEILEINEQSWNDQNICLCFVFSISIDSSHESSLHESEFCSCLGFHIKIL